jgi:hypothetical protein
VTGRFEHDNELSSSVEGGKFLDKLSVLLGSQQGFWFRELVIHQVILQRNRLCTDVPCTDSRAPYLLYNAVRTTRWETRHQIILQNNVSNRSPIF